MDTNSRGTKRSHDQSDATHSPDIEDMGQKRRRKGQTTLPVVTCHTPSPSQKTQRLKSWKETLGPPPLRGTTRVSYYYGIRYNIVLVINFIIL